MFHVDNESGVSTMPPLSPVSSQTKRWFTEGPPTYPGADWYNIVQMELFNVVEAGGLELKKDDNTQLTQAIKSLIFGVIPVGVPLPYPAAIPPAGFLKCNGAAFDKVLYPALAEVYPSGLLPDLRGEFIRGWDDGRGVDSGRAILTAQGDATRNAAGVITFHGGSQLATGATPVRDGFGVFGTTGAVIQNNWSAPTSVVPGDLSTDVIDFNLSRQVPVANEIRPRNTSFNYIVRAA